MTKAHVKNLLLGDKISKRLGIYLNAHEAQTLRRAELTLHRWHELECGDRNDFASFAIERNDNGDGKPFMVAHHYPRGQHPARTTREPIADRENGAIRRVKAVCDAHGLFMYVQTDPRGCSLYVAAEPLNMANYTDGVACCV